MVSMRINRRWRSQGLTAAHVDAIGFRFRMRTKALQQRDCCGDSVRFLMAQLRCAANAKHALRGSGERAQRGYFIDDLWDDLLLNGNTAKRIASANHEIGCGFAAAHAQGDDLDMDAHSAEHVEDGGARGIHTNFSQAQVRAWNKGASAGEVHRGGQIAEDLKSARRRQHRRLHPDSPSANGNLAAKGT